MALEYRVTSKLKELKPAFKASNEIPKRLLSPVPYEETEKPDKRTITLGFNLLLYAIVPAYYLQVMEQQQEVPFTPPM